MLFVNAEDFLTQVRDIPRMSREEEKALAQRMISGDDTAREALVRGYLPLVACYIHRAPPAIRTLKTVYTCIKLLENRVDRFNFLQDSETFAHHLGWGLRQCITRCIAYR